MLRLSGSLRRRQGYGAQADSANYAGFYKYSGLDEKDGQPFFRLADH